MTSLGGSAVDKIIIHKQYNSAPNDYDLAMMRLKKPLALGGRIVYNSIHVSKHTINYFDFNYLLSSESDIIFLYVRY